MHRKILRVFYAVSAIAIMGSVLFVLYIAFLFLFPPKPPIQYEHPVKVLTPVVKQGDPVELNVVRCSQEDVLLDANVQFLGPEVRTLEQTHYFIQEGCSNTISKNNVVPEDLEPGRYKLVIILYERVNATKIYNDRFESEEFEVIAQ